MKILVYGAGVIGSIYGARLHEEIERSDFSYAKFKIKRIEYNKAEIF